ncbi:MAG TPA: bacteriohemerythrin [Desulfovibrio sp.]|jgi:hemerythrin|uniref:bacteriohemerythrin n=1 Tax=Desulfovibrio TaxID=872 RepID=UPI000416900B|nr:MULTISPECIES: bacteriohemerythrin [Desulfovibrio]MDY0307191.1 bacteriohemerythrin [Desulfovibrionaceae bacterium]HMM37401.1 bacteriohemerythrin [Desulfovibrio sp.]
MPLLQWNQSLTLGHAEIDEQHRLLVEAINELHDRIQEGAEHQGLLDAVQGLAAYADYHFSDEERLMLRHGFPELEDHRLAHMEFRERMDACSATIHHSDSHPTAVEMLSFLTRWLARHIQRDDRAFIDFVNRH